MTTQPTYKLIAADLRARIENGDLPPGGPVPSLGELSAQWKCSRMTASNAYDELKGAGLIAKQGRSYVVLGKPVLLNLSGDLPADGTLALDTWADDVLDQGHNPTYATDIAIPRGDAIPGRVLELLDLGAEGRVIIRRETRQVDGSTNMLHEIHIPISLAQGTRLQFPDTLDVLAEFARIGHPVTALADELTVRHPTESEAATLGIPNTAPVQEILRTGHSGGQPVLVAKTVYSVGTYRRTHNPMITKATRQPNT